MTDFEDAGATLAAIAPHQPKYARQHRQKMGLDFELLSDPGNRVAASYGIKYVLPDYLRTAYENDFGLDLERFNGDDEWALPLPARFIIDRQGIIRAADVQVNHHRRPEPEEALRILRNL